MPLHNVGNQKAWKDQNGRSGPTTVQTVNITDTTDKHKRCDGGITNHILSHAKKTSGACVYLFTWKMWCENSGNLKSPSRKPDTDTTAFFTYAFPSTGSSR